MDLEKTPYEQKVIDAHNSLKSFLDRFEHAKRGGIHDFIEMNLANMVNSSIQNIDDYLRVLSHKSLDPTELMHIVTDSFQKVVDGVKRNLDQMKKVNFK